MKTDNDEFRPVPWHRRLLLLALGVATAVTIVSTLLAGPGGVRTRPPADAPRCAAGQDTGCVGGTATVIVTPPGAAVGASPAAVPANAASAASAARPGLTR